MLPSPLPLALAVIGIQLSLLDAVQSQPAGDVRSTLPLPPSESKDALLDDSSKLQSIPLWVIARVWPATVIVPDRV